MPRSLDWLEVGNEHEARFLRVISLTGRYVSTGGSEHIKKEGWVFRHFYWETLEIERIKLEIAGTI